MTTIYDVAKRAGVAPSTVSRVFNKNESISEKTTARVLQAASELEYDPNPLASALASSRTLMVGLVISDIQNPFSATLARGVQDSLNAIAILQSSSIRTEIRTKNCRCCVKSTGAA